MGYWVNYLDDPSMVEDEKNIISFYNGNSWVRDKYVELLRTLG